MLLEMVRMRFENGDWFLEMGGGEWWWSMVVMVGYDNNLNEELNQLLEEYAGVFTMPTELSQYRSFDHKIPFKTDNVSINIRPYRYPPTQKDTIETMIKELLDSRIVRPSNSPSSSPIVMVKKKDRSWRMCIDYRHLNKKTVKDKFLILMIEELIDELHGALYVVGNG
uniref:Retrovirus-related Pol polyprotein from transposon 297 family n=1 Tax=Tanacetum cinerariifolium TaxID=118510 RepID=A0A699K2Q1_TANCI|nr:retrovirus-related Pol polyprotein from transposon 297 family [Tanacetum cinerariifolium]